MECREVEKQGDECEIHVVVVGATFFYENLRFALLASSWLPLPLGILLWSALHLLLVFSVSLLFVVVFSLAVCYDINTLVTILLMYGSFLLLVDIVVLLYDTIRWFFLMMRVIISCQATPGNAAKVACERITGIRVFFLARWFCATPGGLVWKLHVLMLSVWMLESCWRGAEPEPGELAEPGEALPEPGEHAEAGDGEDCHGEVQFLKRGRRWRMKRWCEEIVPRYDAVRV